MSFSFFSFTYDEISVIYSMLVIWIKINMDEGASSKPTEINTALEVEDTTDTDNQLSPRYVVLHI